MHGTESMCARAAMSGEILNVSSARPRTVHSPIFQFVCLTAMSEDAPSGAIQLQLHAIDRVRPLFSAKDTAAGLPCLLSDLHRPVKDVQVHAALLRSSWCLPISAFCRPRLVDVRTRHIAVGPCKVSSPGHVRLPRPIVPHLRTRKIDKRPASTTSSRLG